MSPGSRVQSLERTRTCTLVREGVFISEPQTLLSGLLLRSGKKALLLFSTLPKFSFRNAVDPPFPHTRAKAQVA